MLQSVCFIRQRAMEYHVKPDPHTSVISIASPRNPDVKIPDGFHSVIRVYFDDLYEEALNEKVGAIPDLDLDGHALNYRGLTIPDISHARMITDFIERINRDEACMHLIVHCHAGVSRSAAVAKFVSETYRVPIMQANDDTSAANRRLLRLFKKILSGDLPDFGKYKPNKDAPPRIMAAYHMPGHIF